MTRRLSTVRSFSNKISHVQSVYRPCECALFWLSPWGVQNRTVLTMVGGDTGQSEPLWTFTIVTTAASSGFAWLHDRQPVILNSQEALDRWLDTSTQTWDPKLSRLLDPYSDSDSPLEW